MVKKKASGRRTRRTHNATFKAGVALAALREDKTMAGLLDISRGSVYYLAAPVSITMEAIHAVKVIEQAFARHGTPEIVNTDQGSQFTADEFTSTVCVLRQHLDLVRAVKNPR